MGLTGVVRWALLAGMAALLAACVGRGGSIPYAPTDFRAPDAPAVAAGPNLYKLAPLDTISMTVFQVPDLSRDYVVDASGQVAFPLIGAVTAVGRTPQELATEVQTRLAARYLQNPNVTISLKESATRVVTVDGSVRQPGVFPAVGPMTLLQAVALARGADDMANPHRVAIFRLIDGQRKAAAFDLESIRRGEMADPQVYAGDTVVVDGSRLKQAQRNILQSLPFASVFMAIP